MAAPNLRLPDAAIDAAARAFNESLFKRGRVIPWDLLDESERRLFVEAQRAACEAFVRKWL